MTATIITLTALAIIGAAVVAVAFAEMAALCGSAN